MTRALLAAWLALPLVMGMASAADITNPLWRWNGSRWVSECPDKALCREACDLTELLAASRDLVRLQAWVVQGQTHEDVAARAYALQGGQAQRFRRAVEACGP